MDISILSILVKYLPHILLLIGALGGLYFYDLIRVFGINNLKLFVEAKKKKKKIALRIFNLSGKEEYEIADVNNFIKYKTKIADKELDKGVIYDDRALSNFCGIPILNCNQNDVRPINFKTGLNVNVPGDVINKLAIDSVRGYDEKDQKDKDLRNFVIKGMIVVGVILIVGLSYIADNMSTSPAELAGICENLYQSTPIIVN